MPKSATKWLLIAWIEAGKEKKRKKKKKKEKKRKKELNVIKDENAQHINQWMPSF